MAVQARVLGSSGPVRQSRIDPRPLDGKRLWSYARATLAKLAAAVLGARPVKTVQVVDGQRRFRGMSKAVYATGWNGDFVISTKPDRRLQVSTAG